MGRGRGPNTADSYIGSLISLTSKSEIRYEGILYTVDTENSNIALQNVRSFGTEGRKKDGPQIPASDKVYDYIIFRGSDIKDLQVKSSPPPSLQPPPLPSQPTDPAIISLQQSQPQYPTPSSLGLYNSGAPAGGSSSEPSAPPAPYMGMPPSQYRGAVSPLYPSAGLQSWGPPPPPSGVNGAGLGMPMYWQGYYRPPPAGHMQHQPIPPQLPLSLAAPPQGGQQQQGLQAPSPPAQLTAPAAPHPPGPVTGPSFSGAAGTSSQSQAATSASGVPAASAASAASATPVAPSMAATTAHVSSAVTSRVTTQSTAASAVASSIGTSSSGSGLGVPVSAASSLHLSIQGVSAMITPMRGDARRSMGMVSQAPPASSVQGGGSLSQGLHTPSISSAADVSSGGLIGPQGDAPQSSGTAGTKGAANAQEQTAAKLERKGVEAANAARSGVVHVSSQEAAAQEHASQPLLPLPSAEQTQQGVAQRKSHGVGQRNRWQGNGCSGNGTYNRRGRGRGSGSGRGSGVANPMQQFMEDFDFTAMNEKFNKDKVWGTLRGKGEGAGDEEEYGNDDGHVEDAIADHAQSDACKKTLYNKDEFFDSLSCDTLDREIGRGERTKFSEQRKIDTETFGAFPVRSRGGRGFHGGRRGGYRGRYFSGGGGSHGIGRGDGCGRGRGMGRPSSAIT